MNVDDSERIDELVESIYLIGAFLRSAYKGDQGWRKKEVDQATESDSLL